MSAKKAVPHEAISQHIDRIERLGYQPFRDAAQKLGVDASGGNSEIRSRISAHVQAKGLRSLDRVATGAERASRATAKAELTKLMSLTGASSRARAQAVAAGLAEHDRIDTKFKAERPHLSATKSAAPYIPPGPKIAQVRPIAMTNALQPTGHPSVAHNMADNIRAALGPGQLARVVQRNGDVHLESKDGRWSVRNPAPGTFKMMSSLSEAKSAVRADRIGPTKFAGMGKIGTIISAAQFGARAIQAVANAAGQAYVTKSGKSVTGTAKQIEAWTKRRKG